MRKLAVIYHKAHMSLRARPSAPVAGCGRPRSGRVPRTAAACAESPGAWPAACLAFAAVRPGFFAACIVEAVAEASGSPATPGAGSAPGAGPAGRAAGHCRPGAASAPSRRLRPRGGRSRATGDGYPRRGQQNGQMEHFSKVGASPRKGVRRGAAITPRERADARDLRLTTLGSEPCVQSSIFGFVMT